MCFLICFTPCIIIYHIFEMLTRGFAHSKIITKFSILNVESTERKVFSYDENLSFDLIV